MDLYGKIVDLNKNEERVVVVPQEKLIGMHFSKFDFLLEEENPLYCERISKLIEGNTFKSYESRIWKWSTFYFTLP